MALLSLNEIRSSYIDVDVDVGRDTYVCARRGKGILESRYDRYATTTGTTTTGTTTFVLNNQTRLFVWIDLI